MKKTILVISGVSGVGKNSVIKRIVRQSGEFVFIPQYTTRVLRIGERERIKLSETEMDCLEKYQGHVVIHASNGRRYAVALDEINCVVRIGRVPVIDWPLSRYHLLSEHFGEQFFFVYLLPPSVDELKKRLGIDNRDQCGDRLKSGIKEVTEVIQVHKEIIDFKIVCEKNEEEKCARRIIENFYCLAP